MKITIDLPEDLVKAAMKASHIDTKSQVIIVALQELIRKSKLSELKRFKGKIDLDINLDAVRGRQCRY
jgi:hypothetical protein